MDRPLLVAVMGPTGSGKTELAEALADRFDAQLINADAFQVYRGMDIGTGKSTAKERYRLLDLMEPSEQFGLGEWTRRAQSVLETLWDQRQSAVLVGGTGLYVRALMEQYETMSSPPDPALRAEILLEEEAVGSAGLLAKLTQIDSEAASRVDASNPLRVRRALEKALQPVKKIRVVLPDFKKVKLGISPPPDVLRARIDSRIANMLAAGWVPEVQALRDKGISRDAPGMKAIGYRTLIDFLDERLTLEESVARIEIDTRRYAKRQRTWLRTEPNLKWIKWEEGPKTTLDFGFE